MKKIICLIVCVISMLTSVSCISQSMAEYRLALLNQETKQEDEFIDEFINCLKNGSSEELLKMFSKNAIEKGNINQQENIELIMSILGSDFTYENYSGHTSSGTIPKFKNMRKTLQINGDKNKYKLIVKNVFADQNDADEIGIRQVILCSEENYGIFNVSIYNDSQKDYGVYIDNALIVEKDNQY